jgi:S-adenosyl-L-methionine hydrolase (adenosine-forming)
MPCITLLSDFGLQDASVAIARGVLMQYTDLPVIDISHEVQPFLTGQAAYLLATAYRNFPKGTVHLLLFDLFSDVTPRLVLSEYESHYFLAPDSGVVPMALGTAPDSWLCLEMGKENSFDDWLNAAARTTHELQNKKPAALGLGKYVLKTKDLLPSPETTADGIACQVIHIDHYENVVLNITRPQFESLRNGRNFRLQFMMVEEIEEISNGYYDVREGYKLCRFNSNGYMEICINRGRAASLFGLRLGSKQNDIKILFE